MPLLTADEHRAFLLTAATAPRGVYRNVPVPLGLLHALDFVHGIQEAQWRGKGHADRPLWPWTRKTPPGGGSRR